MILRKYPLQSSRQKGLQREAGKMVPSCTAPYSSGTSPRKTSWSRSRRSRFSSSLSHHATTSLKSLCVLAASSSRVRASRRNSRFSFFFLGGSFGSKDRRRDRSSCLSWIFKACSRSSSNSAAIRSSCESSNSMSFSPWYTAGPPSPKKYFLGFLKMVPLDPLFFSY